MYTLNKHKKTDEGDEELVSEREGKEAVQSVMRRREAFDFDTSEWFWTTKMTKYCCCFKSLECFKKRKDRIKVYE